MLSILFISTVSAGEITTRCAEHHHVASVQSQGTEHANHRLLVDGVNIKEIEQGHWFVDSIKCTPVGFAIEASHVQYNDPEKLVFMLKVLTNGRYELR